MRCLICGKEVLEDRDVCEECINNCIHKKKEDSQNEKSN